MNFMKTLKLVFIFLFLYAQHAHSNDSVVKIGAGGITFSENKNISLLKEKLQISAYRISVDYEFENTSESDIEVTVGFPIPPYTINWPSDTFNYPPDFKDFKVTVDGVSTKYDTEIKSITPSGEDLTQYFISHKINYSNFANFDFDHLVDGLVDSTQNMKNYEINSLSQSDRKHLVSIGALREDGIPLWLNKVTYYWKQKFPAKKITKISHNYTPFTGLAYTYDDSFSTHGDACLDPPLLKKFTAHNALNRQEKPSPHRISYKWVKYILVTANSWKMPIKDFDLIVTRAPNINTDETEYVSFCWDQKVTKIANDTFESRIKDFQPKNDLAIYWYSLQSTKQ